MNNALDSIDTRTSIRSYSGRGLDDGDRKAIGRAIDSCTPCPFGTKPRFALVEPGTAGGVASGRIGTYGIIKNAPAFVVGAMRPAPFAFADYGYALEGVVLAANESGLGTCWLGGTFDKSAAAMMLPLADGEIVPAVTPIGEPAERRSFIDTTMRTFAGAKRRKPWSELFFDGSWDLPLADAGPWARVLEAVRKGPSASNKQPWRLIRTGSGTEPSFHLFLDEDRSYNNAIPGVRIQEFDMGIAMRHFEAAAVALGLPGTWVRLDEAPTSYAPPLLYYSSWIVSG